MADQELHYLIEGLHGASGTWVRLGRTETKLTQEQAHRLVRHMTEDTLKDGGAASFVGTSYVPSKFDAFRAIT